MTAAPVTEARRPPFDDLQPTVEWQVNGRCNVDRNTVLKPAAHLSLPRR